MRRDHSTTGLIPLGAAMTAFGVCQVPTALAADPENQGTIPVAERELQPIRVQGAPLEEARGYQPVTTRVGRIEQSLLDIPQSVSVVTAPLIEDRGADSLEEALRNVASLTFNAGEGGRIGDNITLRGYSIVGDLFLDGMRDAAQYNREVFNLEQIDVLRGSASMLFGRGSTGGVVNQASKQPHRGDSGEFSYTGGSYDYQRVLADVNLAFGEGVAARLNAMYTDTDSFRDHVRQRRWGVAPSVSFALGSEDDLTAAYYRLEDDNLPDYGVPFFAGEPLAVPTDRFYGLANADYERNETGIATLAWQHRFDERSALRTTLRHADYSRDLWATAPRLVAGTTVITDDTVMNRQRQARGGEEETWTLQSDLTTAFAALGVRHEVLGGVELVDERAHRWNYANGVANPPTTVGRPNARPPLPPGYFDNIVRTNPVRYDADTVGVYLQDLISFTPHWKLLLGGRYDDFGADYQRPQPQGALSRNDHVFSWRAGLMYQPLAWHSYYASVGTSFNPSGELYALDDRSANTPPEESRNLEIGAKWELLDGQLSLRTALARSEKTNERNTDLSMPNVFLLSGRRHTDSLEFEVVGRPLPKVELSAAFARLWAEIDEASGQQAGTQGMVPINTPDYTASLWATWLLTERLKFGGGVEAVGDRYGNATNTNVAPAYHRFDAMVEYETEAFGVQLNVLNLADTEYYEGVYSGHVVPGVARTVHLKLEYRF